MVWAMQQLINALLYVSVGWIAGFIGSLLGIGGGSLTTPLLILTGVEPHKAVSSSLIAIMGTSLGGIFHLYRHGLVKVKMALLLELASGSGAFLGVLLAINLPSSSVSLIVAFALLISAIAFLLFPVEYERKPSLGVKLAYLIALLVSLVAGFFSGTAGVGGGIIKVPILTLILGLDVKTAVSTSKLMVGITASVGALMYGYLGTVDLLIAIPLVLGTYSGAWVGARVLTRVRALMVRFLAAALFIILSLLLILRALGLLY